MMPARYDAATMRAMGALCWWADWIDSGRPALVLNRGEHHGPIMDPRPREAGRPVASNVVVADMREIPEASQLVAQAAAPSARMDSPMVVSPHVIWFRNPTSGQVPGAPGASRDLEVCRQPIPPGVPFAGAPT